MEQVQKQNEAQKYIEIPCASCGEHYWKIPERDGYQDLRCPKCRKETRVMLGKEFRIFPISS